MTELKASIVSQCQTELVKRSEYSGSLKRSFSKPTYSLLPVKNLNTQAFELRQWLGKI